MKSKLSSAQTKYQTLVAGLLNTAGIKIGGYNPWDIQVHNDAFYKRVLMDGETGMGESYMEGWWDATNVDELICKILRADLDKKITLHWPELWRVLQLRLLNLQSKKRAFINGQKHYDLGNDLFQAMLDSRMNYSCGYWKNASCLCQAQENKVDLICRKLALKPGMRVLDIGCGWGAFGKFAAEKYGVKVVGITVSKEQIKLGQKLCEGQDVEFRMMDYRNISGQFDRLVSVGMLEHVGYKNYRSFFEACNKCLTDNGLFLLHTIAGNLSVHSINGWTNKYIFPNAMLPSLAQLSVAAEGLFVVEDLHNFGKYYDDTLMAWYHNFKNNRNKFQKITRLLFTVCGNTTCYQVQVVSGHEKCNYGKSYCLKMALPGAMNQSDKMFSGTDVNYIQLTISSPIKMYETIHPTSKILAGDNSFGNHSLLLYPPVYIQ